MVESRAWMSIAAARFDVRAVLKCVSKCYDISKGCLNVCNQNLRAADNEERRRRRTMGEEEGIYMSKWAREAGFVFRVFNVITFSFIHFLRVSTCNFATRKKWIPTFVAPSTLHCVNPPYLCVAYHCRRFRYGSSRSGYQDIAVVDIALYSVNRCWLLASLPGLQYTPRMRNEGFGDERYAGNRGGVSLRILEIWKVASRIPCFMWMISLNVFQLCIVKLSSNESDTSFGGMTWWMAILQWKMWSRTVPAAHSL